MKLSLKVTLTVLIFTAISDVKKLDLSGCCVVKKMVNWMSLLATKKV